MGGNNCFATPLRCGTFSASSSNPWSCGNAPNGEWVCSGARTASVSDAATSGTELNHLALLPVGVTEMKRAKGRVHGVLPQLHTSRRSAAGPYAGPSRRHLPTRSWRVRTRPYLRS